jgi:hypothetical protein
MSSLNGFARAVAEGPRRGKRMLFCLAGVLVCGASYLWLADWARSPLATAPSGEDQQVVAERYVLPVTAPLDQGDTGLCWVFATLSMLETNYMSRHPGAQVEFSRAGLQRDAIVDRFRRFARGEPGEPGDGGLAVEALNLIRQNGLVEREDYHDIVDSDPLIAKLKEALEEPDEASLKEQEVDDEVTATLGAKPAGTHLDGKPTSPADLARAALGGETWTEFDLARDGVEGWGPSHDPDARADTRVRYVPLATLVNLIHWSLKRGESVVIGTVDHALLVYGAEYDREGKPISYFVKDSFAPYLYRETPDALNRKLNDVTVAINSAETGLADGDLAPRAAASPL